MRNLSVPNPGHEAKRRIDHEFTTSKSERSGRGDLRPVSSAGSAQVSNPDGKRFRRAAAHFDDCAQIATDCRISKVRVTWRARLRGCATRRGNRRRSLVAISAMRLVTGHIAVRPWAVRFEPPNSVVVRRRTPMPSATPRAPRPRCARNIAL